MNNGNNRRLFLGGVFGSGILAVSQWVLGPSVACSWVFGQKPRAIQSYRTLDGPFYDKVLVELTEEWNDNLESPISFRYIIGRVRAGRVKFNISIEFETPMDLDSSVMLKLKAFDLGGNEIGMDTQVIEDDREYRNEYFEYLGSIGRRGVTSASFSFHNVSIDEIAFVELTFEEVFAN